MHAIHWARSNGWIVFHADGREVMTGGFWIQPSQDVKGQFDQPQVFFFLFLLCFLFIILTFSILYQKENTYIFVEI
jgi:hypothetical protein